MPRSSCWRFGFASPRERERRGLVTAYYVPAPGNAVTLTRALVFAPLRQRHELLRERLAFDRELREIKSGAHWAAVRIA